MLFYEKKGYGYLLEEKDIKNKLYDLIKNFLNDKSNFRSFLANSKTIF